MKKRFLAIDLVLLFVFSSVVPISIGYNVKAPNIVEQSSNRGNTLYVGGSGPNNYTKIQNAIDDAVDGDTVFIFNDSSPYYEKIVINKSISLIGEEKNSTIINGTGPNYHIIEVNRFNVSISELTVENNPRGMGIDAYGSTIFNCSIRNCEEGIGAGLSFIYNNEIYGCTLFGINLGGLNIIRDNIISNNGGDGILSYTGEYNLIEHNIIINNEDGIGFLYASNNIISDNLIKSNIFRGITDSMYNSSNTFLNNTIINNGEYGICIRGDNATIYHNNFIENYINAYDGKTNNNWDNGYPSGGNYWDDYNGTDNDGDGIGDTPYPIKGGSSTDRYPLMKPWGNEPPDPPIILGPTTGKVGQYYEYNFVTSDPDDFNNVSYFVNWGDGTISNWTDFVTSETMITLSHNWKKKATYTIFAKAKDNYNTESDWTTLKVTIPRTRASMSPLFLHLMERFSILQQLLNELGQ